MTTHVPSSRRLTRLFAAFMLMSIAGLSAMPLTADAAARARGEISETTLSTETTKPTIRGTAKNAKSVTVIVTKRGSTRTVFEKKNVTVKKSGEWSMKAPKSLSKGRYDVKVTTGTGKSKQTLDTADLAIGKTAIAQKKADEKKSATKGSVAGASETKSAGVLSVATIPLLAGGVVKSGESVPISYLQVRNTGTATTTLTGFTVKQNGSAPISLITGLSTVDDKGGSRATSTPNPFKEDGTAFVPTNATIAPGGLKLFTIKASVAQKLTAFGTNFKLDVTKVHTNGSVKATYPLRGTLWMVGI